MSDSTPEVSTVKQFILAEFLPGEDPQNLTETTPLMSSGILDSLALLKLISFLEKQFGIAIAAHEADEKHFNTLGAIGAYIDSKR